VLLTLSEQPETYKARFVKKLRPESRVDLICYAVQQAGRFSNPMIVRKG